MKIEVVLKTVQPKKPCLWGEKKTKQNQNKTLSMENILCQTMQEASAEMISVTLEQQSTIKVTCQQG